MIFICYFGIENLFNINCEQKKNEEWNEMFLPIEAFM